MAGVIEGRADRWAVRLLGSTSPAVSAQRCVHPEQHSAADAARAPQLNQLSTSSS